MGNIAQVDDASALGQAMLDLFKMYGFTDGMRDEMLHRMKQKDPFVQQSVRQLYRVLSQPPLEEDFDGFDFLNGVPLFGHRQVVGQRPPSPPPTTTNTRLRDYYVRQAQHSQERLNQLADIRIESSGESFVTLRDLHEA